jgi:hypothetical protein
MVVDLLDRRVLTVGDMKSFWKTRCSLVGRRRWALVGRVGIDLEPQPFAQLGEQCVWISSVRDGETAQLILGVAHTLQKPGATKCWWLMQTRWRHIRR